MRGALRRRVRNTTPRARATVAVGVDAHAVHPADVAAGEDEHDQEGRPGREALLHPELRRHAQDRTGEEGQPELLV